MSRVTLNLSADEANALAMLLDAAVTNAVSDDDAAVLERVRAKLLDVPAQSESRASEDRP